MKKILDLIWEPESEIDIRDDQEYISTCCCGGAGAQYNNGVSCFVSPMIVAGICGGII